MINSFKIRVQSSEMSSLIQLLIFNIGGMWMNGEVIINNVESSFLIFYGQRHGRKYRITYTNNEQIFTRHENREITFEQLVEEVEQEIEQNERL